MPQVNFYESGGHIVVEAINIELKMSGGNKWEKGNWNGTKEQFEKLQIENPGVEFTRIEPRHSEK